MSKYSLREILGKEELVVKNLASCASMLLQGLETFLFPDSMQRPRLCLKSKELVVILTGGHDCEEGKRDPESDTFGFVLSTNKWVQLPMMPYPRTRHVAAVCDGQLYVVGGNKKAPLCYFNPARNKWFANEENLPPHQHSSFIAHNEELYMIGGEPNHQRKVKKYNCKSNKWKELSSMKVPRVAHCTVVLEELIYVMAGSDGNACLKSVECYKPSNDQWDQSPDMINERKFAAAAVSGGKIIVVGGYHDMSFETIEVSCEIFDKSLNQWRPGF
ncbi:Kelch-like protein 6 [Desmophyllum pertusum]|uniref:Kelch-like protein 6 n=1 Tax=Desmophyllum pertusum TaxID=174260 RepID=A0A9W9Z0F3_9CNID|nr:Kelch-like protein 6 [Desmophyllum pertusum]